MSLEPVLILRCGGPWCGGRAGGALVLFRPGVCPWRVRGETASSAACAPRYNDRYATLKPREWTQVLARSTCLLVIGVSPDVDWPHVHSTQSLVKVPFLYPSIYLGGCGVLAASCPGGLDHNFQRVLGSSPRSALYKICANKKIGKK